MPTKTLQSDERVMPDHPICLKLDRALARLRPRKLTPNVWGIEHQEFGPLFKTAVRDAGRLPKDAHPYQMAHGGASTDALHGTRSLVDIKTRGRWALDSSVRRYEKHARHLQQTSLLPHSTRP